MSEDCEIIEPESVPYEGEVIPRVFFGGALCYNKVKERIYSVGGDILVSEDSIGVPDFYYFDLKIKSWVKLKDLPCELHQSGVISYEDKVYTFGGESNSKLDLLEYSHASKDWTIIINDLDKGFFSALEPKGIIRKVRSSHFPSKDQSSQKFKNVLTIFGWDSFEGRKFFICHFDLDEKKILFKHKSQLPQDYGVFNTYGAFQGDYVYTMSVENYRQSKTRLLRLKVFPPSTEEKWEDFPTISAPPKSSVKFNECAYLDKFIIYWGCRKYEYEEDDEEVKSVTIGKEKNYLHCLNLETRMWKKVCVDSESILLTRIGIVSFIVQNYIYVYGGVMFRNMNDKKLFTDLYRINLDLVVDDRFKRLDLMERTRFLVDKFFENDTIFEVTKKLEIVLQNKSVHMFTSFL